MASFNYADLRHVIVAASTRGSGISDFAYVDGDNQKVSVKDVMRHGVFGTRMIAIGSSRGRQAFILGPA